MLRSRTWRAGTDFNGKSRSRQAVCRIFIESTTSHARRHHALLIGLVLRRRAGSCPQNTSPGNIGLGYSRYMARHIRKWISRKNLSGETSGTYQQRGKKVILLKELEAYIQRIGGNRILEERIDLDLISPYKAQSAILAGKNKRQRFATSLPQSDNSQYRRRISRDRNVM